MAIASPRSLVFLPKLTNGTATSEVAACLPWEVEEFGQCTPTCNEGYRFVERNTVVAYDECVRMTPKTVYAEYITTCSNDMTLCPYPSTSFNGCFDLFTDTSSCGTCLYDCNTIPGLVSPTCVNGMCKPGGCHPGYTLWVDGMSCIKNTFV